MKKILIVLLTILCLAGCATKADTSVSDGDAIIFKGPDGNYTKADLYKSLKVMSEQPVVIDIINKIATMQGINKTDLETKADEAIQSDIDQGYEFYITYYYGSIENYRNVVLDSLVYTELKKNYILEDYNSNLENDNPVKMQVAYFDDEALADKSIEDINAGSTFDTAVLNNGFTGSPQAQVYLDSDDLPIQVKTFLKETSDTGVNKIITTTTSNDADGNEITTCRYYLINVLDRDVNNLKDEYLEKKASTIDDETLINHLFATYEIKFYDQDLYKIMSNAYEVLK